jgi:2-polyprenyl-3-methyl-5-hydroxy-6-metoxy-1,4-benzoquinol methylase
MKHRSYTLELLDAEYIPEKDLIQNLKELKFINTHLGGHAVIKKGFKKFFEPGKKLTVLEIGSGGGDNLMALKKKYPEQKYIGLDLKSTCISYAKTQDAEIEWILHDFLTFSIDQKVDVAFNSLFCHHFKEPELVKMLKWMHQNTKLGFFIGDLHRHWLAYFSIKTLTALFSKSYLVKNDAPLSVKRGFTKAEWVTLLAAAGIENYTISWCWAFRHLITVKKS